MGYSIVIKYHVYFCLKKMMVEKSLHQIFCLRYQRINIF
jgi:hypothetical protein